MDKHRRFWGRGALFGLLQGAVRVGGAVCRVGLGVVVRFFFFRLIVCRVGVVGVIVVGLAVRVSLVVVKAWFASVFVFVAGAVVFMGVVVVVVVVLLHAGVWVGFGVVVVLDFFVLLVVWIDVHGEGCIFLGFVFMVFGRGHCFFLFVVFLGDGFGFVDEGAAFGGDGGSGGGVVVREGFGWSLRFGT